MAESERMAVVEERLSNLLRAFNEFRTEDAICFADFRQEQQESFDKLEAQLTRKLEEYSTRIHVLELWRSGLMGAWGVLVLLWGGLLAWIKFGQGKS